MNENLKMRSRKDGKKEKGNSYKAKVKKKSGNR